HHGIWISITLFFLFLTYLFIRITVLQLRVIEQRILFRLPYLGELLKYHYLQFIFQILTITQQAGLPLLKGLDIIIQQLPNPLYHHALCQLREHIIKGKSLSAFMKNESLFPPICYQFIISAENSG
ncbi:type II secretion system F family protein, partial [Proteus myxofaciens]|uniref:type II secretion system F family protein n=1 Tax=Proteus myxofaciens TaxID=184072 RepID=UPI001B31693F